MDKRINVGSGTIWEDIVGYCRAVRSGNTVEVSGTTAVDENGNPFGESAYEQAKFIIIKIEKALLSAGAELSDVVRTRIYTTDISKWEEIGKAHGEFFGEIKPASTMVEVKALIDKRLIVEIEATAIIND